MNKEVSKYIKRQKSPQKEICTKLRKIILKTFPKIDEKMKMGVVNSECLNYWQGALDFWGL